MEHIRATLPTVGQVDLAFHRESKEVLDFFGRTERSRLDKVRHLGVATAAFTGLNHTRWEYTLLQCALIQFISTVYKKHPHLSMKANVRLDGLASQVSSGEELLKCWALLGNAGHAQWTYGVERGILQVAQDDGDVRRWLLRSTNLPDLREWIAERVEAYDDLSMHYILALRRLADGRAYDQRKTRYAHVLRNLLLPVGHLLPDSAEDRSKLSRLRRLYGRVRLLSLVTFDAYNSHKPLRVALHTTLNTFGQIAGFDRDSESTERMLTEVAAWLADEHYLHPDATAVQLEYEQRVVREFSRRFRKAGRSKSRRRHLLGNLLFNGVGRPLIGRYRPLLRLTFGPGSDGLLGTGTLLALARSLRSSLCRPPVTEIALDRNVFSGAIHLDLFKSDEAQLGDLVGGWTSCAKWLIRRIEGNALATFREMLPKGSRTDAVKARLLEFLFRRHEEALHSFFHSIIGALIPPTWSAVTVPLLPSDPERKPLFIRLRLNGNVAWDEVGSYLATALDQNPDSLSESRLQELRGLKHAIDRAGAPLVIACAEPITLYDGFGEPRDDWDGTVIEVGEKEIRLHIFEAKSGRPASSRANQAFKQLAQTRDIVCGAGTRYRRVRLTNIGATQTVTLAAT